MNAGRAASASVVAGLIEKIQRHMHTEHSRQIDVFHKMDADGSGTLTAVELHRALAQMEGDAPTRSEVDALLQAVDENGNGTVSIEEFFNYFKHARRSATPGKVAGAVRIATTPAAAGKAPSSSSKPQRRASSSGKDNEAEQLERRLRNANDENYLLQMQLTKLQATLKKTQSKLDSVQTWRDASAGSPKSPYEPLFEKQVASLKAQLATTEEKLKRAHQSQLQLRAVQTWQAADSSSVATEEMEPRSETQPAPVPAAARVTPPRRMPWAARQPHQADSTAKRATEPMTVTAEDERNIVAEEAAAELMQVQHKAAQREREAAAIMKEQNAELEQLRQQLSATQQSLATSEASNSGLMEQHTELELLYSRGDGAAQRKIAELEGTVSEVERERSEAREKLTSLEQQASEWKVQRAEMEGSLREAAEAWEALGQQEVELKEYTAVKRERDDVHAKLAIALSVTKEAEARAAKADKQLDALKKKRGKHANGAAKQWDKERSEMESVIMAERAKADELTARIDLFETNKQVMEAAQVKLRAKLDACMSADAAQQELAEAHTATLEQNRKLVADLVASQGFEGELQSCRAELAAARASLKKEAAKRESLQVSVTELETARNTARKGEGEKGVVMAQLREQVHTWKSKAEKRKEKLAGLAKELSVAKQDLEEATARGIRTNEALEAHEEDGRMWRLVAEQAQEEESRLSVELERAGRRVEEGELRLEEATQQLAEQSNSTRQATAGRDNMHRELSSVLEAIARGDADEMRRRYAAGESFTQPQPEWLGPQQAAAGAAAESSAVPPSAGSGSYAWMDDPLGTGGGRAREEQRQWRSESEGGSDRSRSPSLLSDDGEGPTAGGSGAASSSSAGSMYTYDSLNVEQALERGRQRAAESRRQQQQQEEEDEAEARVLQQQQQQQQQQAEKDEDEMVDIGDDEVAFMAMAAAREVTASQMKSSRTTKGKGKGKRSTKAGAGRVDARQARTPVTSSVRSQEAAQASAARRRNKRVKQRQKMARLSAAEGSVQERASIHLLR
jgi:hypothetical protein